MAFPDQTPVQPRIDAHNASTASHPAAPLTGSDHFGVKPGYAPGSVLSQSQQGAYDLLASTLKSWGLDSLLGDLKGFIQAGDTSPDTLSLKLSQTTAYKQRFAANEERRKNGLPELLPAQYIGLEEQYNNVMRAYGLPQGFYDSPKDFTDFIGKGLSPDEIKERAQIAHDQYQAAPAYMRELWGQYYGTKGDAIAAILDPNVAQAVIEDRSKQVGIGAAGAQYGFGVSASRAQQFAQSGVTLQGAQQAYRQIAAVHGQDQAIAQRFGQQFSQQSEENDLLLGDPAAAQKRRALYGSEEALFQGRSGVDASTLGVSQSAP